jgi:GntR family transcriptional regulator
MKLTDSRRIVSGYVPKYRQLVQILRQKILLGEYGSGARLPSEEELTTTYGLSRGTVRQAMGQLEDERLISTEHGVGSFVLSAHPRAVPFRFVEPPGIEGFSYEVLAQEVVSASFEVAQRLRLEPGTRVIHIARRRRRNGEATVYTERYVNESVSPDVLQADLSREAVHRLLVEHSELPLLRAEVEVEAHVLTAEEAILLDAPEGTAAVVVERLTYTAPNRPAVWYRGLFKEAYFLGVEVNLAEL